LSPITPARIKAIETSFVVETADVIFAVDSIPAVPAVTTDPFVVYTSNVFALLGMRALYFLLAGAAARLRYLKPGLAVILGVVAVKLLLADVWEFPAWSAPAFISAVLAVVAAASVRDNRRSRQAHGPHLAGSSGCGHAVERLPSDPAEDADAPGVTGKGASPLRYVR
jgi:predicted tellurium resistance membrane protein TerC